LGSASSKFEQDYESGLGGGLHNARFINEQDAEAYGPQAPCSNWQSAWTTSRDEHIRVVIPESATASRRIFLNLANAANTQHCVLEAVKWSTVPAMDIKGCGKRTELTFFVLPGQPKLKHRVVGLTCG
jgi:hypothetical protein